MEKNPMEAIESLAAQLSGIVGIKRTFGGFVAEVTDDGSIVINGNGGWSITYPPLAGSWMVIAHWLVDWNETAQESLSAFVSVILYPVSMSLPTGDDKFVDDVAGALSGLVQRTMESGTEETPVPVEIVELFKRKVRDGKVS